MKINVEEREQLVVVTVEGNVMQEYVPVFRSRLSDLIERGKTRIVLNLADSSYMSSMCLAVIVDAKNRTTRSGGDIVIANANDLVRNLMQITNLNKKIAMFDLLEDAIAVFEKKD